MPEDIKYVLPHQANERIVKVISRKVKIPMEKFYLNIAEYGNTSAASIPIALNEMYEKGILSGRRQAPYNRLRRRPYMVQYGC